MGDSVIVHLIRHERTKANLERKYIGWTDESILNKHLTCQLPIQTEIVFGSDLKRCYETAMLYFPRANYQAFSQLRELSFGDFEMKTYDELKHLNIYRQWIDSPYLVTPPNGELFQSFENRVLDCFQKIVHTKGEYVFVVHGGVIRLLLSKFQKDKSFQEIHVAHRMIYTLCWKDFQALKGGEECNQLLVEPITVSENM